MLVTRRHPSRGVLFGVPRHLGEKNPTIDFYVELSGESPGRAYFLAQVKSTRRGYTAGGRLKLPVGRDNLRALAAYPAPTYLVGVDEAAERAYLLSASGASGGGWNSMCTDHELTPRVLARLWDEVNAFWTSADREAFASALVDPRWRRQ